LGRFLNADAQEPSGTDEADHAAKRAGEAG
jgi:hypothetical protein